MWVRVRVRRLLPGVWNVAKISRELRPAARARAACEGGCGGRGGGERGPFARGPLGGGVFEPSAAAAAASIRRHWAAIDGVPLELASAAAACASLSGGGGGDSARPLCASLSGGSGEPTLGSSSPLRECRTASVFSSATSEGVLLRSPPTYLCRRTSADDLCRRCHSSWPKRPRSSSPESGPSPWDISVRIPLRCRQTNERSCSRRRDGPRRARGC